MEDGLLAEVVKIICEDRVVDPVIIKRKVKADDSTVNRIIGALLSSGYIVEVKLSKLLCRSCPLRVKCSNLPHEGYAKVYTPSEKLEELCKYVGMYVPS
ncbi:MAG: hypothetical protein QW780_03645 [Sulfolobales archaeon]